MLYARLYRFSYLIFQSLGEMGMIVPTLQIRERIEQDSTVREVAGSDCKIHSSAPPHLPSPETSQQWEKGV